MNARPVNVAIVEDDDSMRRSLVKLLRAAGLNPVSYSTGEGYLKEAWRMRVDCLILDIQLGSMLGFDVQEKLKARGNAPPIIFVTATEGRETRERAQKAGCSAYFTKPVPGPALLAAIRQAVAGAGA